MLGQWIDGLTDEQRDRVVRAERWEDRGMFVDDLLGEPICLVAHVYGMKNYMDVGKVDGVTPIWRRFDALCHRFGLERTVRALKLRAGADLEDLGEFSGRDTGRVEPRYLIMEAVR